MTEELSAFLDSIEAAGEVEQVHDLVHSAGAMATQPETALAFIERLDERRERLRQWTVLSAYIGQRQLLRSAAVRADMEAVAQELLKAGDLKDLVAVVERNPVVFTGSFLGCLTQIKGAAEKEGDIVTATVISHRLESLQLIQLANLQDVDISHSALQELVIELLDSRDLSDLLELVSRRLVLLSGAFERVLRQTADDLEKEQPTVPQIIELRISVLSGLRDIITALGNPEALKSNSGDVVEQLINAQDADRFLAVIARSPHVLGEAFGEQLQSEITRLSGEGEAEVVTGLQRRQNHLRVISQIVEALFQSPEEESARGGT